MGEMVRYGILPNPYQPGVLIDFYGNAISSGGGSGFPIANPFGITEPVTTPDPISGTHTQTWVKFPANQSAIGWGLTGDTYPRAMFGSDPKKGLLFVGDGTYDPTQNTNMIDLLHDVDRGDILQITSNGTNSGAVIGALSAMGSGLGNPNSVIGGFVGDIMSGVFNGGTGFSYSSWWRCITGGNAASAVWALELVIAATDPVSTSFAAANAGALWQNTASGGQLWISTGTGAGGWRLIGGDTGWIDASGLLVNSWTVLASQLVRYRKLNNVVHVEMGVQSGSTNNVFTLPAGFRPSTGVGFLVDGNTGSAQAPILIDVGSGTPLAAGVVNAYVQSSGATPSAVDNATFSFVADA